MLNHARVRNRDTPTDLIEWLEAEGHGSGARPAIAYWLRRRGEYSTELQLPPVAIQTRKRTMD